MVTITNLPHDILMKCMSFVGKNSYLFVALTNKWFRYKYAYFLEEDRSPIIEFRINEKCTSYKEIVSSSSRIRMIAIMINSSNVYQRNQYFSLFLSIVKYACIHATTKTLKLIHSSGFFSFQFGTSNLNIFDDFSKDI